MHHGIVETGVKLLPEALDPVYTELLKGSVKLVHYHLNALAVGLVLRGLCQRTNQIIINGEELRDGIGLDLAVQSVLLLLTALAEVIILGHQAEILVVCGFKLVGQRGLFLAFLFFLLLVLGLIVLLALFSLFFGLRSLGLNLVL